MHRASNKLHTFADILGLLLILAYLISLLPSSLFVAEKPTGGDMASHYWTYELLSRQSLPHLNIRVWNPGNLTGEPHLVHYFPLPFITMAILALFMAPEIAFKFGIVLPVLLLPAAVYFMARMMRLPFPAPLWLASGVLVPMLTESFSMWGGNGLSLAAGQFAHSYALVFLFLYLGCVTREVQSGATRIVSPLFLSAVILSHSYVFIGVFFFLPAILLTSRRRRETFKILTRSVLWAVLISSWYLLPLVENAPYTTPFSLAWKSENILAEIFNVQSLVVAATGLIVFGAVTIGRGLGQQEKFFFLFFGGPIAGYLVAFFLFPHIGLVDIRALPQVLYSVVLWSVAIAGVAVSFSPERVRYYSSLPLVVVILWLVDSGVSNFPNWLNWNFTGWKTKPLATELNLLTERLRGDFSQPRVVYEHSDINRGAGTERVFELLPLFSSRATLESVYMQATPTALPVFHLQAEVSKTPSCPFKEQECPKFDLERAEPHLRLMGVGTLILASSETKAQAEGASYLRRISEVRPWTVFELASQPALVEVLDHELIEIPQSQWRGAFYEWFKKYPAVSSFLVAGTKPQVSAPRGECQPKLEVTFNLLRLSTNCPNRLHLLKISYHPSWRADDGSALFFLSPGFLGVLPTASVVNIEFGQSFPWWGGTLISFSALALYLYKVFQNRDSDITVPDGLQRTS